jgi:hypothetical protein
MNVYDVRDEFEGRYTTKRTSNAYLVVHHAAALYPTRTGIEDVRAVARYHTNDRGWPGIGYHICLAEESPNGPIARYDVSDPDLQRAHILDRNHQCLGVSCLTNFTGWPEQKWIDALVETLRGLKRQSHFKKSKIVGHGEIAVPNGKTSCPGPAWPQWKQTLISAVEADHPVIVDKLPDGTYPVYSAFRSYYDRSGGVWQPDRACLGYALKPFDQATRVQQFERGHLRLNADGTVTALLLSELVP